MTCICVCMDCTFVFITTEKIMKRTIAKNVEMPHTKIFLPVLHLLTRLNDDGGNISIVKSYRINHTYQNYENS